MKNIQNKALIKNVSRRNLLKGMVGTGGLVLAAQFVPGIASAAYKTGAGGMPGGAVWDPHSVAAGGVRMTGLR